MGRKKQEVGIPVYVLHFRSLDLLSFSSFVLMVLSRWVQLHGWLRAARLGGAILCVGVGVEIPAAESSYLGFPTVLITDRSLLEF